jgi:L-asparaginase
MSIQPKLIIHGGAGNTVESKGGLEPVRESLYAVINSVYPMLLNGESAIAAVVKGCELLENDPRFNAGTGSVLQSDGQIRMSAAIMDGDRQSFSGVINTARVKNPIYLAQALQTSDDRVLSDYGSVELIRELGIPVYNPLTDRRLQEWLEERKTNFSSKMADVAMGTIGVVALDRNGRLCAGTSTGGRGFERIGRVSDSAMPAGNYATAQAAVSCTGVGEDIIDECLAAKIAIRVTDGMSLQAAVDKSFAEGENRKRDFGAICLDANGAIAWGKTTSVLFAAFHDGTKIGDTLV